MALKSMEQEWEGFSQMIFRSFTPSENQYNGTREAFFAGAYAMLCGCRECGADHVSEEQGMAYMNARGEELEEFFRKLISNYVQTN